MSEPVFDKEGSLRDLDAWTTQIAADIAAREGIELTPAHFEVIACNSPLTSHQDHSLL